MQLDDTVVKEKEISAEEELKHFKNVVKSLMRDAINVLAEIELFSHGEELEEKISILNHYLDYTLRLSEGKMDEKP